MGWNALAIGQRWTNSTPPIYLSFYYDLYRSGATQYYKFYTSVSPVHGSSSFGYDINQNIYVDGSHVSSYQLKPVSPSTWTAPREYATDWIAVSGKTSGTTAVSFNIYSTGGEKRNQTYSYTLSVSPAGSSFGTISTFNIEDAFTIPVTKYDDSFVDTLQISIGNSEIRTISGYLSGTEIYLMPEELALLYSQIELTAQTADLSLSLTTTSGGTTVGSNTATATCNITGGCYVGTSGGIKRCVPCVGTTNGVKRAKENVGR